MRGETKTSIQYRTSIYEQSTHYGILDKGYSVVKFDRDWQMLYFKSGIQ